MRYLLAFICAILMVSCSQQRGKVDQDKIYDLVIENGNLKLENEALKDSLRKYQEGILKPTGTKAKKAYSSTSSSSSSYGSSYSSPASSGGQCSALTKKRKQCSRAARSNGYCWQHGG